jgi:hypothetical protein
MHAGFSFSYSPISLLLRQPLSIKKSYAGAIQGQNFFFWDNNFMSHFSGHFEGASTGDNLRGQKSLGPLKMSLEMAHKVIVQKKKIMSRSFLNIGTLIVIFQLSFFLIFGH